MQHPFPSPVMTRPPSSAMNINLTPLLLSLLLWGLLHSLLASEGAKGFLRHVFGDAASRVYRLGYNLFAVASFFPVLWFLRTPPDQVLYRIGEPWIEWTLAGQLAGILLLGIGLLQTDPFAFAGLRQLVESEPGAAKLATHGLYRYVRHPLYSAGLLTLWLSPLMTVKLLALYIGLTAYILIGATFEERRLLQEFGSDYADYKSKTPMFIPFLLLNRRRRLN